MVHERAIAPVRGTRPYVGRRPVTPSNADGQRIDPHVSEPIANPTRAAAVADPEPEDEPQLHLPRSQGLLVAPLEDAAGVL
jgi:hypothetical protein